MCGYISYKGSIHTKYGDKILSFFVRLLCKRNITNVNKKELRLLN